MGQVSSPQVPPSILLTATDRLVAVNADGGVGPGVSHIILLGEAAGRNDAASDVIGIGERSLGGAGPGLSDAVNLRGSIAIGSFSQSVIESAGSGATVANLSNTTLGRATLGAAHFASANVVIGDGALALNVPDTTQPTERMVVIGANAARDVGALGIAVQTQQSVVLGYNAARPAAGSTGKGLFRSVVIGDSAAGAYTATGVNGLAGMVVIGAGAALNVDASFPSLDSIVIGRDAGVNLQGPGCVLIGAATSALGIRSGQIVIGRSASSASVNGVAIGETAVIAATADNSVAVGSGANFLAGSDNSVALGFGAGNLSGARAVLLGAVSGGNGEPAAGVDRFIVETNVGAVRRCVLYGDMGAGNLIVGLSTPAVNRDMPGTNILKLLNGTATGNPVGGGMFFVTAGLLSWRDAAGVTYGLTPAGQLASRSVAFTNNAAAALGTLANAPVAGNPTKWIPVNDNGTIRNIPAW